MCLVWRSTDRREIGLSRGKHLSVTWQLIFLRFSSLLNLGTWTEHLLACTKVVLSQTKPCHLFGVALCCCYWPLWLVEPRRLAIRIVWIPARRRIVCAVVVVSLALPRAGIFTSAANKTVVKKPETVLPNRRLPRLLRLRNLPSPPLLPPQRLRPLIRFCPRVSTRICH